MRYYADCPRVAPPLAGLGGECNCHGCGHAPLVFDEAVERMVAFEWAATRGRNRPYMERLLRAALNEAGEEQHETFTPTHPTVLITESNEPFVAELAESIHLPVNAVIDQAEMKDGRMTMKWHVEPTLTGTPLPDDPDEHTAIGGG